MKAKLKIERCNRITGQLLQSFEQESRSFTEGLMQCLYPMFTREVSTVFGRLGFSPMTEALQKGFSRTYVLGVLEGIADYTLAVFGGHDMSEKVLRSFDDAVGNGIQLHSHPRMSGIFFGEGDTAVDSRDQSLELPIGLLVPSPLGVVQLDTALASDTSFFFDGTNYYAINDAVTPNHLYTFNAAGALTANLVTNQAGIADAYWWNFVLGGFLYGYRDNGMMVKIDLVTGITALSRDCSGDTLGNCKAGFYDSVAGNIVGINDDGQLVRWKLLDFTVDVAALLMGGLSDMPLGVFPNPAKMSPIEATNSYIGIKGSSSPRGWIIYDVANNLLMPMNASYWSNSANIAQDDIYMAGAQLVDGWVYEYQYRAAGHRVNRTRIEMRNVHYTPVRFTDPDCDAVDGEFSFYGEMINESGGDITVKEIGIHAVLSGVSPLISRDILGAPVVLGNDEFLRGTYTISASI